MCHLKPWRYICAHFMAFLLLIPYPHDFNTLLYVLNIQLQILNNK